MDRMGVEGASNFQQWTRTHLSNADAANKAISDVYKQHRNDPEGFETHMKNWVQKAEEGTLRSSVTINPGQGKYVLMALRNRGFFTPTAGRTEQTPYAAAPARSTAPAPSASDRLSQIKTFLTESNWLGPHKDAVYDIIAAAYQKDGGNPEEFKSFLDAWLTAAEKGELRSDITIPPGSKESIMLRLRLLNLFTPAAAHSVPSARAAAPYAPPAARPTLGPGHAREVDHLSDLQDHKDRIPSKTFVQQVVQIKKGRGENSVRFYMPGAGNPDALVFGFCGNFLEDQIPLTPSLAGGTGLTRATTGEAVFQAGRANDTNGKRFLLESTTGEQAFDRKGQVTDRPDWLQQNLPHMREVIAAKFAPGTRLAELLVATEDLYLIEDSGSSRGYPWTEGKGNQTGSGNWLGQVLMEQRARLQEMNPPNYDYSFNS
ncbi:NADAR family protein [Simkania negevensis]|uniref:NADAR family protein n=1 Tax=Simkania negevensis TaxID=83561 RepID=A0ABS3AU45_9BACT|nr:NADAR family protein [Simkania negevensis]